MPSKTDLDSAGTKPFVLQTSLDDFFMYPMKSTPTLKNLINKRSFTLCYTKTFKISAMNEASK
jgi:hypothetical protein